jgi:hypothetical protein
MQETLLYAAMPYAAIFRNVTPTYCTALSTNATQQTVTVCSLVAQYKCSCLYITAAVSEVWHLTYYILDK